MKKTIIIFVLLFCVLASAEQLPSFELKNLDGNAYNSTTDKNSKIILLFGTADTANTPLLYTLSLLKEKYPQVHFMSIHSTVEFDIDKEALNSLQSNLSLNIPIYLDEDRNLLNELGYEKVPVTLVVDAKNEIVKVINSEKNYYDIVGLYASFLEGNLTEDALNTKKSILTQPIDIPEDLSGSLAETFSIEEPKEDIEIDDFEENQEENTEDENSKDFQNSDMVMENDPDVTMEQDPRMASDIKKNPKMETIVDTESNLNTDTEENSMDSETDVETNVNIVTEKNNDTENDPDVAVVENTSGTENDPDVAVAENTSDTENDPDVTVAKNTSDIENDPDVAEKNPEDAELIAKNNTNTDIEKSNGVNQMLPEKASDSETSASAMPEQAVFLGSVRFVSQLLMVLAWGLGLLYCLAKVKLYKRMLIASFACLGFLAWTGLQTVLIIPQEVLVLNTMFVDWQQQATNLHVQMHSYSKMIYLGLVTFVVIGISGKFKNEESNV